MIEWLVLQTTRVSIYVVGEHTRATCMNLIHEFGLRWKRKNKQKVEGVPLEKFFEFQSTSIQVGTWMNALKEK